jgi:UDP-glucose 4-epimerase
MLPKTVVVVGSAGFVGSNLAKILSSSNQKALLIGKDTNLLSPSLVRDQIFESGTCVVWLASSVTPSSAELNPSLAQSDLDYFSNTIVFLQKRFPSVKIVLASSGGAIYAEGTPPYSEDDPLTTKFAYSKLKVDMEQVLTESGLPHVILRVANAYGPGQPTGKGQGVLAEWMHAIKDGRNPKLFGSSAVIRDFVHIEDVVQSIWLALDTEGFNGVINIGSGQPVSLNHCLELLKEITNREIMVEHLVSRSVDRYQVYLSINRAAEVLNWVPRIDLKTGLSDWWVSLGRDQLNQPQSISLRRYH